MEVKGRNILTGLPKTIKLTSEEIRVALKDAINQITETVHSVLEKTPPGCRIKQLPDMTLSSAWTAFMEKGQQPLAPEDYIEVEK